MKTEIVNPGTPSQVREFYNQNGTDHASNAGLQYSSDVANRAQIKLNQYGPNTGVPGESTIKSRGPIGGPDLGVIDGDIIWGVTAVGVTPLLTIPLSGLVRIQVPVGGSVPGNNWIASELEVQLVPLAGPINGRQIAFKISSEFVTLTRRGIKIGGPATPNNAAGLETGAKISGGNGDPNTVIVGSPGDLWLRQNGGANTTLYVKESGVATNTGWVAK